MRAKYNKTKVFFLGIMLVSLFYSCSKWDEFKMYTKNGAISYAGKLDSVQVSSGKERIRIKGILKMDPKITKCKIFWNDFKDSVAYDLPTISSGRRIFDKVFMVSEGVRNFVIYTYDNEKNRSVAVNIIGTSYGDTYRRRLNNRLIGSVSFASNKTTINWEQMDLSTGGIYTETEYTANNRINTVVTPVGQSSTILEAFNFQNAKFRYRTIFRPDTSCIDTFATAYFLR